MQYSLVSRFQGTLLGAVIAEGLESNLGKSRSGAHPLQDKLSNYLPKAQGQQLFQLNQVAWLYAETLIKAGDIDDTYLQLQIRQQAQTQSVLLSPTETLVGIIPVSLFFHEDEVRLRQKVLEAIKVKPTSLELQLGALAVAYGIAQCLREQLDSTLIPRTIAYLNQASSSFLVKQLEQVHRLLEQRVSLEALLQHLELQSLNSLPLSASIALAFYCFLSTSEDYWLTVARAARIGSPLTAILAGALSGAHNSTVGIPSKYRLALLQGGFSQGFQMQNIAGTVSLIANQLLATWSGAYEPTQGFGETDLLANPAVAAPGVIRPR